MCTNKVRTGSKYIYDANGNMQSDTAYDVNGSRVRKYASNGTDTYYLNNATGRTEVVQKGTSNSVYTYNIYGSDNIGQILRNGATVRRYYYLKDHLGTVRMLVDTSGAVDSYTDVYPYGMQMPGRNSTASGDTRYKYTGKERDTETGWDCFGARYYDARISRWLAVDPMAEKYAGLSPFSYCADNPLKFVDTDGRNYGVRIDSATHTITIYATYYVWDQVSQDAAKQGTAEWNAYRGTYTTGDGQEYSVNFDLSVVLLGSRGEAGAMLDNDPTGNAFLVSQKDFERERKVSKASRDAAGITAYDDQGNRREIYMPDHGTNADLFAHEIGHTLFQGHGGDVMRASFNGLQNTMGVSGADAAYVGRDALRQARVGSETGIKVAIQGDLGGSFYRSWFTRWFLGNGVPSMYK